MKKITGVFLILLGLVMGIYIGFYLCFIGGILQIVIAIKSPDISEMSIAWGIAKIVFSGTIGILSAIILIIPGKILFNNR